MSALQQGGHAHKQHVEQQFGGQAAAYLSSQVHAEGAEFAELRQAAAEHGAARVLDLGCGAGHVGFQVAEAAREVVAYDLSAAMLEVVAAEAARRGLDNLGTLQGAAERLPFADGDFDLVFSRYSAHHWGDVGLALREARRVLKPGGRLALIDVMSPGQPLLDTYLQAVEVLRDSSHVRDYSAGEWLTLQAEAGFEVDSLRRQRLRLDFDTWIARMRTPPEMAAAIRLLQQRIGKEVRDYFAIEADGSFCADVMVLWAST